MEYSNRELNMDFLSIYSSTLFIELYIDFVTHPAVPISRSLDHSTIPKITSI